MNYRMIYFSVEYLPCFEIVKRKMTTQFYKKYIGLQRSLCHMHVRKMTNHSSIIDCQCNINKETLIIKIPP